MGIKMTIEIPEGAEGADLLRQISEILNPSEKGRRSPATMPLEIVKEEKHTPEKNPGRRREDLPINLEDLDVDTLKKAAFSNHTIAMVANKVLGIPDYKKNTQETDIRARGWLSRPLRDSYFALYVSILNTPPIGKQLAIVGLNEDRKFHFLHLTKDLSPSHAVKNLLSRGLRVSAIETVVTKVDFIEPLEDLLPKTRVQLCWDSLMLSAPKPMRPRIKEIMQATTMSKAMEKYNKAVKSAPDLGKFLKPNIQDLMTFFSFDKELWRSLRILGPLQRYETEVRKRLRIANTEKEAELISTWTALRFQYHWQKIPVDAESLSHLKYMKQSVREA